MPQVISTKDFDAKVQELGSVGAAMQWAKANGYAVDWEDVSSELPPVSGQKPIYKQPTGGLSVASEQAEAAPEEGEADGADTEEEGALPSAGGGGLELLGYLRNQQKTRKQVFDEGQKYIAQAYAGPSVSQQLFALSKALLSPKKYSGFAGTMANVSSALSDVAKAQQEAKQKRALAEAQLFQTYKMKTADDMYEEAKLRYMIDKAEKDAAAKAALLGMPKYDPLPSGGYQIRPGTGGLPPMPTMDQYGNYVITDPRQIAFLPPNTKIVRPGDNPMKPKYVPARPE